MRSLLERISWATRKWNFQFYLFNLILRDQQGSWGIEILRFSVKYKDYALLAIDFRLPNKTTVQRFVVDDWDFLFLRNPLYKAYDNLSDRKLWSPGSLSTLDHIKLRILTKLFR